MKILNTIDLGVMPYEDVYFLQKKILRDIKLNGDDDYLLLAEHPDIFTIGRNGSRDNILVDEDILNLGGMKVIEVDRGGDITFHGIGQLVAYPVFDLARHIKDVRLFIRNLEEMLARTISEYGLTADKEKRYTGLWVDGNKIGFIGIGVSHWITYHGVSINANVNLKYFSMIRPCGIPNVQISSLQKILNRGIDIDSLKRVFIEKCCGVFGFEHSRRCHEDAFVAKKETS